MASLESIYFHLVLPYNVPGSRDSNVEEIQHAVIVRLIQSCQTAIEICAEQDIVAALDAVRSSLEISRDLNQSPGPGVLRTAFEKLQSGLVLTLHIDNQNAALLVRHADNEEAATVIFEAFEVSPPTEDVIAAEDALCRCFPDRAVELPLDVFLDDGFLDALADFLEQASLEALECFAASSVKASVGVPEIRNATDASLILQMLMSLLEALGNPSRVTGLSKRVRDEVNIRQANLPWRRLPFWLVIKISVQRQLEHSMGPQAGRLCYKLLICTTLGQLLDDGAGDLSPEMTITLRAKLCRRLAKLELEKSQMSPSSLKICNLLLCPLAERLQEVIQRATLKIERMWSSHKRATSRSVPKLPGHARRDDLKMTLPNSGEYLKAIPTLTAQSHGSAELHDLPGIGKYSTDAVQSFANRYRKLEQLESGIMQRERVDIAGANTSPNICSKLASYIDELFDSVGDAYKDNAEEISGFILTLFDLWIEMDRSATDVCPLLRDYHPIFSPDLLDVLQLPSLTDMKRLASIQSYLKARCANSRNGQTNIFSPADQNSFSTQYVQQSKASQRLENKVLQASMVDRETQTQKWRRASQEYDERTQKMSELSCSCSWSSDGTQNFKGCTRCWHWRCRKRIKVDVHEDFLPEERVLRSAVVFELSMPGYLRAYRDATWHIVRDLVLPGQCGTAPPAVLLVNDCDGLRRHIVSAPRRVSLGSSKKSFAQTHYGRVKMKVGLDKILLPQAARFLLYDVENEIWVSDFASSLTFFHLCGIRIPGIVDECGDHAYPTSYDTIASQTVCPTETSVHEYMAYQGLVSGITRRWPRILVELGSSTLNFSSEITTNLITQLAIQVGPRTEESLLRDIHVIFDEQLFCSRLADQIEYRLSSIMSSWRETYYMELLITLLLRLFSLTTGRDKERALGLLRACRAVTMNWISRLQQESRSEADANTSETLTTYTFQSALLCRRTFAVCFEVSHSSLGAEDLIVFIRASVALQENLIVDPKELSLGVRNMYIRDLKVVYRLRPLLQKSFHMHSGCLETALSSLWPVRTNLAVKPLLHWECLSSDDNWLVTKLDAANSLFSSNQIIHYHFVEGHLLIDGKPLSRLPHDLRESEDVKDLFGTQHLLTYPSAITGMSHRLANLVDGNEIHFGLRDGQVIIRSLRGDVILEYIPQRLFVNDTSKDLPSSLIENCTHWFNLDSACLEIRRRPTVWRTRPRDWILDVDQRQASRGTVSLVDPHSDLGKRVALAFQGFELPERLTIYQPHRGRLCVELRHLELSFFVNKAGLLQCRELHTEIDTDQDAGTLYGFQSKIVMRDVDDSRKRCIIFPLGSLVWKRQGIHVTVRAVSSNEYGKFDIDSVLGRLTCPPEPRLLYSQALCHATTSFALPDLLTGRTGVEEALAILKSGRAQPWTPLSSASVAVLKVIAALSPKREFYPSDKRQLQTVMWDSSLTYNIQHDGYESIVQGLLAKSMALSAFVTYKQDTQDRDSPYLRRRAESRRLLYERSPFDARPQTESSIYPSKNRTLASVRGMNVYRITKMVCAFPVQISMTKDLRSIFRTWSSIQGCSDLSPSTTYSLNDLIHTKLSHQWGSLISFCRNADAGNPYPAIFRLSILCFGPQPEVNVIKSLIAILRVDELRALCPPSRAWFVDFRAHEVPSAEVLEKLIQPAYNRVLPPEKVKKRQRYASPNVHQLECEAEGKRFARAIVDQWPDPLPSIEHHEFSAIDPHAALQNILPEWDRLRQSMELSEYIERFDKILRRHVGREPTPMPQPSQPTSFDTSIVRQNSIVPTLAEYCVLRSGSTSPCFPPNIARPIDTNGFAYKSTDAMDQPARFSGEIVSETLVELDRIFQQFAGSTDPHRCHYGKSLQESLAALHRAGNAIGSDRPGPRIAITLMDLDRAEDAARVQLQRIRHTLGADDDRFSWLHLGDLWPAVTPITVLQLLRSRTSYQLGNGIKESLVCYGLLITKLQQLRRIFRAQLKQHDRILSDECENQGHTNWDPMEFPDWLLLEIDSDMLIRGEQVDVCHAIVSPASGANSVLQLNMGKGKTFCIVPMAMARLADKKRLARLVVPKALMLQSAQTIQSRLGGLVDREVRHVPFSRRTPTTPEMLQLYSQLHNELLGSGGLMLTTPEHILAYKLSGLQMLADSKFVAAREMLHFQRHLSSICRDVLDESDFSLAVKTQLVYPSGDRSRRPVQSVNMLINLLTDPPSTC